MAYQRLDYDFKSHAFTTNGIDYYIVPLTSNLYVEISVSLYGGGDPGVSPEDWLPLANEVKAAILRGAHFEGSWPRLQECP
jgi:hypothetical protein